MQAFHLEPGANNTHLLVLREHSTPQPGPHQVLVRVMAASLNRRDLMIMNNTYPVPTAHGVVPLSDGAGEVVAVGANVTRAAVGERVMASYFVRWIDGRLTPPLAMQQHGVSVDGLLAEYALVHEDSVVHIPAHLSYEEAAALPCAALTAWSAVAGPVPVVAGDTVLILGSGGIALAALQFTKALGARAIVVTGGPGKVDQLRALGADEVVDASQHPDWDVRVRELTGGKGVEHVVEAVGPDTLERSLRAAGFDAQVALMGVFATQTRLVDAGVLMGKVMTIRRIAVGSRSDFEAMNALITRHQIRPVIARRFAFAGAPAAYEHFNRSRGDFGKTVITFA